MSCGCKQFNEDHGDPRNLTMKTFQDAAQAAGTDVQQVARNIEEAFQGSGSMTGSYYSGSGTERRGAGGFDDADRSGGSHGTQYETGREGEFQKTGTGRQTTGRQTGRSRTTGNQ
jgi:hypothetical protein